METVNFPIPKSGKGGRDCPGIKMFKMKSLPVLKSKERVPKDYIGLKKTVATQHVCTVAHADLLLRNFREKIKHRGDSTETGNRLGTP